MFIAVGLEATGIWLLSMSDDCGDRKPHSRRYLAIPLLKPLQMAHEARD
jgi:hypothetical protein